jgi:hypothetical protein
MTRKQLLDKYDEVYDVLFEDEELMLKVLLYQFGGVRKLWNIVHTHYTSLHECEDLEDEDLVAEVESVVDAYNSIVSAVVEEGLGLNE